MSFRELILIYEPEQACRERLLAAGIAEEHAFEISSYLAQSTDIAAELEALASACAVRGLAFQAVPLDGCASFLPGCDPHGTLIWTLTDGIAYFRGGVAPALARLNGLRSIGCDDSLFALCQDKFRSGAVLTALGMPVPQAGLARDGVWLVNPPDSRAGWFVKPNRLGAKIGIWPDSHCRSLEEALHLSRRVFAAYRDDVVVQPYVRGRNVRASFLALDPSAGPEALGVFLVDSGSDFQTMHQSLALYGEPGQTARREGAYSEPALVPLADTQPGADRRTREIAAVLIRALGLRDVFSFDLRVDHDGAVHLIEFEVCPGLPCFDFRAYCMATWEMPLAEAMAETALRRFA